MAVLDDLSGFEFEDVMEDVFRKLGYENVRQAGRTADEGRDVLMEEVVDGSRRAIIIECKHTDVVGRPVVQKLHSAIATFDFDGPKRGMVVTTGRFTGSAREYAERLQRKNDPHPIELKDGQDIREIADEVGLDLYNGRIEILCDQTLRPKEPWAPVQAPVEQAFRDIENIDESELPKPRAEVTFRPTVAITAGISATFKTSVGIIHSIDDRTTAVIHADRGTPSFATNEVSALVANNIHATIELEPASFEEEFDRVEERRFGQTETEYKDWAVERLRKRYTKTVSYTGDNNVTYEKTCKPNLSDISIHSIQPVYLPEVRQTTELKSYSYPYVYFAAGPSRVTQEDGIRRCVHCGTATPSDTYTYCENCGSISCRSHTKTERREETPICTGCAVTARFMLKTKYFYNEENLDAFREEYAEMPVHQKAMENKWLTGGVLLSVIVVLAQLLSSGAIL